MSLNLLVKYGFSQTKVPILESNTIDDLKQEIAKYLNIPANKQRIIVDWREKENDSQTLGEAGITKRSRVIVHQKKELSSNPEDVIVIAVEYNGETTEVSMNKDQDAMDLILSFFQSHELPEKVDGIKLKQRGKLIKPETLLVDVQGPIKLLVVEKTKKQKEPAEPEDRASNEAEADASPKREKRDKNDKNDKNEKSEKSEKNEKNEKNESTAKTEKPEKPEKKEKKEKKEKVQSMNILNFLKQKKEVVEKEKTETNPTSPPDSLFRDLLKNTSQPSLDSIRSELKTFMISQRQASLQRVSDLHKKGKSISSIQVVEKVEKEEEEEEESEIPEKQEADSEEAIIEDADPEEAAIVDVVPQLYNTVVTKHRVLNVDKSSLSSTDLLKLPFMLGFRYLHADTDTDKRHIFFGISHASSDAVSGRNPLGRDTRVNYDMLSEDEEMELEGDDVPGDDCNDTDSDSADNEAANRLDYRDGFLEEEDINIGDPSLSAEEKSALVFRSVSGNKGKLSDAMKLTNQPFVLSIHDKPNLGIDLHQCKGIIGDPVFFADAIESIRKRKLEVVEEVEMKKKVNMTDEIEKTLTEMIAGQSYTITQIDEMMQEKYPGLPKRQIESKLHEIAEKRKKVWYIRSAPVKVPIDIDSVMNTHATEDTVRKRQEAEGTAMENDVKRTRIHTEKIPDGTILYGNISHSAFATDPHDEGPSSFSELLQSLYIC